ncbi:MAG: HEPN domain-containing protein [Candidatus Hydrogenedentes bacterium]|nr:HEPN domain-containing protein [Candidatus Hydrogenedentota bacterium]
MDEAKKIAVQRWLIKANNDLRTAKTMLAVPEPPLDTVCFHSQQCAEKALKAYLVEKDEHVERTHSLPKLVDTCGRYDAAFETFAVTAPEVTVYAVTGRYPDDWIELGPEEAQKAIVYAEQVLRFVRERLES